MSAPSDSELLAGSCIEALQYPKNVVYHSIPQHQLQAYVERLDERENHIFSADGKASLDIWDYDEHAKEFHEFCASNFFELKGQLEGEDLYDREDPRCRFFFVHAPHSRESLRISRKMLLYAFTYHQVMPAMLEFIFPFGRQEEVQGFDLYFSGFREETRSFSAGAPSRGLSIPQLGRSGNEICMCYNLMSVERSYNPRWPWSVRQTAVYHSFDWDSGKSVWIMVKGNKLIKDRVQAATRPHNVGLLNSSSFESTGSAFCSTLRTHLILCDWCGEEWRWYVRFLQEQHQSTTSRSLVVKVEPRPLLSAFPRDTQVGTSPSKRISDVVKVTRRKLRGVASSWRSTRPQSTLGPPGPPPGNTIQNERDGSGDFLQDLQRVQFVEERASEAVHVLDCNISILTDLKGYYQSVLSSNDCHDTMKASCKGDLDYFEKRVGTALADLQRQRLNTETLQRSLSDRRSLLWGFHNSSFAQKSQKSADRMERLTEDMHKIAIKTEQETVSMRIITLVTLFFLPEALTLTYSRVKTLMSTDIVKFPAPSDVSGRVFQLGALELYISVTLPLMVITFSTWYGVYWWSEKRRKQESNPDSEA